MIALVFGLVVIIVLFELYMSIETDSEKTQEFIDQHKKSMKEIDDLYRRDWK